MVYQEDYFALLNATETGQKITYDPTKIVEFSKAFPSYVSTAVEQVSCLCILRKCRYIYLVCVCVCVQVKALAKLDSDVKARVIALIDSPWTAAYGPDLAVINTLWKFIL